MVLEATRMETETEIALPESNIDRPERLTCSECRRTFTKRGYEYHKKICSENPDCKCTFCLLSKSNFEKPRVEQLFSNENTFAVKEKQTMQNTSDCLAVTSPSLKNVLNGNAFSALSNDNLACDFYSNNIASAVNDNFTGTSNDNCSSTFSNNIASILNVNCVNINNHGDVNVIPAAESSQENLDSVVFNPKETIYDSNMLDEDTNGTIISTYSDSIPSVSTQSEEEDKNLKSVNDQTELMKFHNGIPCSRKLFCSHCNEHVLWELFGVHILQHSETLENSYIKCPECVRKFSRPTMLLLHYFIHVSTHPFDCVECHCQDDNCIDSTARTVMEHCYAESYHCYICLKVFSHEQSIANHMRLHSKEMPYTCKECNRSFRQVGNLQRHMATHRGDRPHKCDKCTRSFADPATLRNHVRVHTGETPYICKICGRRFTQIGNLKRHMALHLKNQMSSASTSTENTNAENGIVVNTNVENGIVVKTNILEDELKEHEAMNVINIGPTQNTLPENSSSEIESNLPPINSSLSCPEPKVDFPKSSRGRKRNGQFTLFSCPDCNKVYTWKHDLQVHIRTHTGEKPYKCHICDKRFAQSGAVRTHLARHHSEKPKSKKKSAVK